MFPEIRTDRLLMRQITDRDIMKIHEGLSNPEVVKFYGVSFNTVDDTKQQMVWFEELERSGAGIWWGICSSDNSQFFGAAGLNNISKEHKKAEIGYWLLPHSWKKGIISEAIPKIIDYAFQRLGMHRIEGYVETENENSKRILEKMSFNYEGTMKDCEVKNGKYISLAIYSIINS